MQSPEFQISRNVRYLLWKRGLAPADWVRWLTPRSGPEGPNASALMSDQLTDREVSSTQLTALSGALGFEADEQDLRYVDLLSEGVDILFENLSFLFAGLERGGKKALANALQVDPTTVSRWLNGSFEPNRSMLDALAQYFGLPYGTDLKTDPVFLSVAPVAVSAQKQWTVEQIERMNSAEFRSLYPALLRLLGAP